MDTRTDRRKSEAYIDAANLHRCLKTLGWMIDFARFKKWLLDKYGIEHAYFFMGFIPKYQRLYTKIQEAGFILIFKEVICGQDDKAKGNCDVDLVIHAISQTYEKTMQNVVLVTSDGDFASLVRFLKNRGTNIHILSPSQPQRCSLLLKRAGVPIAYLNEHRNKLERR